MLNYINNGESTRAHKKPLRGQRAANAKKAMAKKKSAAKRRRKATSKTY